MSGRSVDDAELQKLGLYDPTWPHADDLLELLHYLLDLGATTDDLVEYQGELPAVASVIALRPGRERLTGPEVSARAGVPDELATKLERAAGFAEVPEDSRVFTEADVAMLQTLQAAVGLFGEEAVVQLARVIGSAMAKIADALISSFLVNIEVPIVEKDPVGIEIARANAAAVALLPAVTGAMDVLLRRHLIAGRRSLRALQETGAAGYEVQEIAVGFVDIVGSTTLTRTLSAGDLGRALSAFETAAADIVTEGRGRVVKLIGDEVMFVAADAPGACAIALKATEAFAAHPVVPQVRAGIAAGKVLSRDGDYFGPVVNLAARVVKIAEPGTVAAPGDLSETLEKAGFATMSVGAKTFEGIAEPVEVFVVKPA
jgi:adenylate cyclase